MTRHADGSVTVTYKVEFTRGRKGQKRVAKPASPPERPAIDPATVPRITRMLVLGYHFERLVWEGNINDYATVARLTGLSRAHITQIVNLTLIAPSLQEAILLASGPGSLSSHIDMRQLSRNLLWNEQLKAWR